MPVGRRPKPTALKRLAGNPGKRPLNAREPQPRMELPERPTWLTGEAAREWKRVVEELYAVGLLTVVDRAALEGYCVAYGRWVDAEKRLKKEGLVIPTKAGGLMQNPYLSVANRAMDEMRKWMNEFGMTPSSRTRVQAPQAKEMTLDDLLGMVADAGEIVDAGEVMEI